MTLLSYVQLVGNKHKSTPLLHGICIVVLYPVLPDFQQIIAFTALVAFARLSFCQEQCVYEDVYGTMVECY
jgi:hypothetical protein